MRLLTVSRAATCVVTWQRISVSKNWSSSRIDAWFSERGEGRAPLAAAAAICLMSAGLLWSPGNAAAASARWSSIRDPWIDAIMSRNSSSSHREFAANTVGHITLPPVLWRCWLSGRKGTRPVKNWAVRCWCGYLSGARCRLAYGPADATATHCLFLQ